MDIIANEILFIFCWVKLGWKEAVEYILNIQILWLWKNLNCDLNCCFGNHNYL
jgi:hypothetical protein